jgi:glyoxylase-like metal-dependent hydrolase (beta-lactamase superfamily II)
MKAIEDRIYIETNYPGVTLGALALPHGTVLIDAPPSPDDARSWRSALINLGSGVDRLLIYLDPHPDRTLGGRFLECNIMAHERTAKAFRKRTTIFKGQPLHTGAVWETCGNLGGIRWQPPQITFTDRAHLHWGAYHVIVEHHPGPDPGAAWVIIPEAKIVFVGDAVVPYQPPFLHTADIPTWLETLNLLIKSYSDFIVISGRGGMVAREVLITQRRFLKNLLRRLERLASRRAPIEATEKLIPSLLSKFTFPNKYQELYTFRLQSGLAQYYERHYPF